MNCQKINSVIHIVLKGVNSSDCTVFTPCILVFKLMEIGGFYIVLGPCTYQYHLHMWPVTISFMSWTYIASYKMCLQRVNGFFNIISSFYHHHHHHLKKWRCVSHLVPLFSTYKFICFQHIGMQPTHSYPISLWVKLVSGVLG